MATVIVLSAEAVQDLIDQGVTSAVINGSGELVLTKAGGGTINLGDIKEHGGLDGLADDDHTQYALADGTRGDFATEAQGVKADAARPNTGVEIELQGGDSDGFYEEITVADDGTSTSGWVNRFIGYFRPVGAADNLRRFVSWFNEYMELRLAPAKHNTVALRIFAQDTGTTQSTARDEDIPLLQLMDDRGDRNHIWGLYYNSKIRVGEEEIETQHVITLGAADPIPTGTPAGTVIVRTT